VAKLGIGRSFQDLKLFKELSCWDNIMAAAAVSTGEGVFSAVAARRRIRREEAERAERVEQILEFTGLQDKRDVLAKELGYAEAKMLALARVLTLDSKTLLLDEPCSGLDHGALDRVREMLAHLVETGHTICLIEHNMALVRDVADVGIFLENGALVAMDSIDNLLSDSGMRERYLGLGEQE
jgi:ABC-type branched-subunit amino acid transport system ATPase component